MEYVHWSPVGANLTPVLQDERQVLGGHNLRQRLYARMLEVFERATYTELVETEEVEELQDSPNQLCLWQIDFSDEHTGNMLFVVYQDKAVFLRFFVQDSANGGMPTPQQVAEAEQLAGVFWQAARAERTQDKKLDIQHGFLQTKKASNSSCAYRGRTGHRCGGANSVG